MACSRLFQHDRNMGQFWAWLWRAAMDASESKMLKTKQIKTNFGMGRELRPSLIDCRTLSVPGFCAE